MKATLILSIFFISFNLICEEIDFCFYKNDGIFLNPIENPDKELTKILKLISLKNYKRAKTKLYDLKLELKDTEKVKILEVLIEFLEKEDNNGKELLSVLDDKNPFHRQIKAEVLWLCGEKLESFKIYGTLPDEILKKNKIKAVLEKRTKNYCEYIKIKIDEALNEGNFDGLCFEIESIPKEIFNEKIFYKAKTICSILKGEPENANIFFNLMEEKEKEGLKFFVDLFNLDLSEQLKELKGAKFDLNQKKLANYLYKKTEDLWLLQNMPPCYIEAYQKENINLKDLSLLFCLYFPQIKATISDEVAKPKADIDKFEFDCIYPLILGKVIKEDLLEEKINGEKFIDYIKKFIVYLNLLNPCEGNWDNWVNCGIIPKEKEREKIDGVFASRVIRKLRGD